MARAGDDKNVYNSVIWTPEGKRPFRRGLNVRLKVNGIVEG